MCHLVLKKQYNDVTIIPLTRSVQVRIVAAGVTWNEHGDSYFTKLLPILSNDQKEF